LTQWWLPTVLGTLAGLLSTASFVPQVLKAWREADTHAISKRTYIVNVTAFVLWTLYGVLLGSLVLIVFNGLSLLLAGTILVLKIRGERREGSSGPAGERHGRGAELSEPRPS
jgi:MtN3 and saliva related transmembrane protein